MDHVANGREHLAVARVEIAMRKSAGWSCTQAASKTMELLTKACIEQTGSQNTFRDETGREFFWEIGREQSDGSATGSVWRMNPDGTASRAGSWKIDPDGKFERGPAALQGLVRNAARPPRSLTDPVDKFFDKKFDWEDREKADEKSQERGKPEPGEEDMWGDAGKQATDEGAARAREQLGLNMKTECYSCGATFEGYPRNDKGEIACTKCGSYEVHIPEAHDNWKAKEGAQDIHDFPEGTTAVCVQCGQDILLDQREGGGPGKDWGATPEEWVGNGGIGMDYGCSESPLNDDDGTGGHSPKAGTIKPPATTAARTAVSDGELNLKAVCRSCGRPMHKNEVSDWGAGGYFTHDGGQDDCDTRMTDDPKFVDNEGTEWVEDEEEPGNWIDVVSSRVPQFDAADGASLFARAATAASMRPPSAVPLVRDAQVMTRGAHQARPRQRLHGSVPQDSEMASDVFGQAYEFESQSIGYWGHFTQVITNGPDEIVGATVVEDEGGFTKSLIPSDIGKAVRAIQTGDVAVNSQMRAWVNEAGEGVGADVADVIIQAAMFGEIKYG